ncbi:hypothetical protein GGE12_001891 [Rhizobium mongolense]|uniref:Uncharacterized protein n=1 Tax=Rhizobium mongolense TaxID=57676 RepID=A0A7W6RKG2_9HYPH|nr:hypothetical protein [Rhizobium mongolense]
MGKATGSIENFTTLYDRMISERPLVSSLLTGHLAIEFLLRRLVRQHDITFGDRADIMRHQSRGVPAASS